MVDSTIRCGRNQHAVLLAPTGSGSAFSATRRVERMRWAGFALPCAGVHRTLSVRNLSGLRVGEQAISKTER